MKMFGKKISTRLKIVAATATVIFTLATVFTSTIAWFSTKTSVNVSGGRFTVRGTPDCAIDSISLYKFDYAKMVFGSGQSALISFDYLSPASGNVNRYDYDSNDQAFYDESSNQVSEMNVYDPIEKVIQQDNFNLADLNCNVVYEITFVSNSFKSQTKSLKLISSLIEKSKDDENDIFLSDCVDFDYFDANKLNGSFLLRSGDGNPNQQTIPNESFGDYYIDTTNYALYLKNETSWESIATSTGITVPNSQTQGKYYLLTQRFYERVNDAWFPITFISGSGAPSNDVGVTNAYYVNTTNNSLYKKGESSWDGPLAVTTGDYAPNEETVSANDYYVSTKDSILFVKRNETWTQKNIGNYLYLPSYDTLITKTPDGSGTSTIDNLPAGAAVDTTYLNTETGDFFVKEADGWVKKTNIEEEKLYYKYSYLSSLQEHKNFYENNPNTKQVEGQNGNYYIDETDDDALYIKDNSGWTKIDNVASGSGAPTDVIADYYIDTSYSFYHLVNSNWQLLTVTIGNGEPDENTTGQFYADAENGYVLYAKENSSWTLVEATYGFGVPSAETTGDYYFTNKTLYSYSNSQWSINNTKIIMGEKNETITLSENETITFDEEGKATIYINVNYAPSRLEKYVRDIYAGNINAIFDYSFIASFENYDGGGE